MDGTPKLYKRLTVAPKQCNFMLPNRLQCWRAGDMEVVETVKVATETTPAEINTYHLCNRHAAIQQAVDAGRMQPEQTETKVPQTPVEIGSGVDSGAIGDVAGDQSLEPAAIGENQEPPQGGDGAEVAKTPGDLANSVGNSSPLPQMTLNPDGPMIPVGTVPPPESN